MAWQRGVRPVLQVAVVSVLVFLLLYSGVGELPLTGFFAFPKNVSVSIVPEQDGEIRRFQFDQRITIGDSINASLELMNTGSTELDATYDMEVYNVNNTLLYTYPGPTQTLQPGTFMKRDVRHTPHKTGTYIVRVRAEMGGDTLQSARFLLVSEEPEPPKPEPITIIRRRVTYQYPPPRPEPEPPTRSWRVEVPRTVTVGQHDATTLPIRVTNTGEATLRNVHLVLRSSEGVNISYEPKIMFGIPANVTRNFMLTVSSAPGVRDDQSMSYAVKEDRLQQAGETEINIVPTVTIAELEREIAALRQLIRDAADEVREARSNGLDVAPAEASLEEAKQFVDAANESVAEEDIAGARQRIGDARSKIGETFQTLFKLRSEQLVVQAPLVTPVYVLIGVSILIAILMVGAYYYLREKHEDRPKLLREMEEEE